MIALGYLLTFICIGLPIWIYTTSPVQYDLPLSSINKLNADIPIITLKVNIIDTTGKVDSNGLSFLDDVLSYDFIRMKFMVEFNQQIMKSDAPEKIETKLVEILYPDDYNLIIIDSKNVLIRNLPDKTVIYLPISEFKKETIFSLFSEVLIAAPTLDEILHPSDLKAYRKKTPFDKFRGVKLKPSQSYQISLSVMNAFDETNEVFANQNLESLLRDWKAFLENSLSIFRPQINFTITGSALNSVSMDDLIKPFKYPNNQFKFFESDASTLVNELETFIDTAQSAGELRPAINLVLGLNSLNNSNLAFKSMNVDLNHIVVPQWGGLMVLNQNNNRQHLIATFLDSLNVIKVLLGMQSSSDSNREQICPEDMKICSSLTIQSAKPGSRESVMVPKWLRMRYFLRQSLEAIASIRLTLTSLVHTKENQPFLVIRKEIAQQVDLAVRKGFKAFHLLETVAPGNLAEAFTELMGANSASYKAFFDPSLLDLLYFPEDQKFGIYIPLFAPISLPVLVSAFKAIQYFLRRRKIPTQLGSTESSKKMD